MAIPLQEAAARLRTKYVRNPDPQRRYSMPLPDADMTESFFANWIISTVPVTAMKPTPQGNVVVRLFPNARNGMSAAGSKIKCGGRNGGTFTDVRVGWVALKLVDLVFEREVQAINPKKHFGFWKNWAMTKVLSRLLSLFVSIGALTPSHGFSAFAEQPRETNWLDEHFFGSRSDAEIAAAFPGAQDQFKLDGIKIPRGKAYQWMSHSVLGVPRDLGGYKKNGWRPVPRRRHLRLDTADPKKRYIIRGGQILMEISKKKFNVMRKEDFNIAQDRIRAVAAMSIKGKV